MIEPRGKAVPPYKLAVSVQEFANMIGVSRPKAYEIIKRSDFHGAFKIDRRTLVSVSRAQEWIDKQIEEGVKFY